jgi:hypothetical protein
MTSLYTEATVYKKLREYAVPLSLTHIYVIGYKIALLFAQISKPFFSPMT